MKRRALLFVLTLVWMAVWVPPAWTSFRLERADGSQPVRGLNLAPYVTGARTYSHVVGTLQVARPRPRAVQQPTRLPGPVSGRCGGSLPTCGVMACESGGDLDVRNGEGSSASGKWQITKGTWGGYGGYSEARDAPEEVQDARARELWNGGAGKGHWRQCL